MTHSRLCFKYFACKARTGGSCCRPSKSHPRVKKAAVVGHPRECCPNSWSVLRHTLVGQCCIHVPECVFHTDAQEYQHGVPLQDCACSVLVLPGRYANRGVYCGGPDVDRKIHVGGLFKHGRCGDWRANCLPCDLRGSWECLAAPHALRAKNALTQAAVQRNWYGAAVLSRVTEPFPVALLPISAQCSSIVTESFRLVLIQILLQRRGIKLNPITTL
eukprot:1158801-Pelagomonas_calceolata.AAC.20